MGKGSYLGGSTIIRQMWGTIGLLPSQKFGGRKKPFATDDWASVTGKGKLKKSSKALKRNKPKLSPQVYDVTAKQPTADQLAERKQRDARLELRKAEELKRMASVIVVTRRGTKTLSQCTLADRHKHPKA